MLNPLQIIVTKRNNSDKATIECTHMTYGSATVIWKFFESFNVSSEFMSISYVGILYGITNKNKHSINLSIRGMLKNNHY